MLGIVTFTNDQVEFPPYIQGIVDGDQRRGPRILQLQGISTTSSAREEEVQAIRLELYLGEVLYNVVEAYALRQGYSTIAILPVEANFNSRNPYGPNPRFNMAQAGPLYNGTARKHGLLKRSPNGLFVKSLPVRT